MLDLVGAWRLTSAYFVGQETGDRLDLFGPEPFGSVIFAPNGRMIVLITPGGRPIQVHGHLHRPMVARR